jgi:SAM-dependent methyltransferase
LRQLRWELGLFPCRKRDLIRAYFRKHGVDSKPLRYLDVGCGKGDLASLLVQDFSRVAGCDPSGEMLKSAQNLEVRVQDDPGKIPFDSGQFAFATAVCVYHHVPPSDRLAVTAEVVRVLRPGGVFAIIEHNPWNPATRIIVKRCPVDENAVCSIPGKRPACLARLASRFKIGSTSYTFRRNSTTRSVS